MIIVDYQIVNIVEIGVVLALGVFMGSLLFIGRGTTKRSAKADLQLQLNKYTRGGVVGKEIKNETKNI